MRPYSASRRRSLAGPFALLALVVSVVAGYAQTTSDIHGRWATPGFGAILELHPCQGADGELCGRIVWLWDTLDARGRDTRNPDPEKRGRPLIGMEILSGFRQDAQGRWRGGNIYNPEDGRLYSGAIALRSGLLELEGCALRVFCQRQVWRRPASVPLDKPASGR